jgi:predicted permease
MMFGVVDRLLIRPTSHVVAPEQLRRVFASFHGSNTGVFSYATYSSLRAATRLIEDAAAFSQASATVGSGTDAREIEGAAATANFFSLLGTRAVLGRLYTHAEDDPYSPVNVAVISNELWEREYGRDENVLGRTLMISEKTFTIIGVLPRGFAGTEHRQIDFWIPMSSSQPSTSDWRTTWRERWLSIVVRVTPGREAEVAREMTMALRNTQPSDMRMWSKSNISLRAIWADESGNQPAAYAVVRWLAGMAVVVLLISCVNVTNLFLSRALARRREIAVRLAMGIDRFRLIKLLMSEAFIIAAAGGIIGVSLAGAGGEVVRRRFLPGLAWDSSPVGGRVLGVSALLTIAVALVTSLFPAIDATRTDVVNALKSGSRGSGTRHQHVRSALLVIQAALAATLLIVAGLFARSLVRVRDLDLGFQPARALSVRIDWPTSLDTATERANWIRIRDGLASAPDVESAALVTGSPFGDYFNVRVRIPGLDSLPPLGGPWIAAVSADYFTTLGIPLIRGTLFDAHAGPRTEPVAIVNETMARALWPGQDALGRCMLIGTGKDIPCSRVVGIVADSRQAALVEDPTMQYYVPLGQERFRTGDHGVSLELLVRPRLMGSSLAPSAARVRVLIARLAPTVPFIRIQPLEDRIDPLIRPWQLGAELFGLFGGIALLVAATGLYSVVAYITDHRMHEFGVRMALGAQRRHVLALVMDRAVRTTLTGIALGVGLSLMLSRWIEPLLFHESSRDPLVIGAVGCVLMAVAVVASSLPASTALGADPLVALRAE